jgi:hypothetical protein
MRKTLYHRPQTEYKENGKRLIKERSKTLPYYPLSPGACLRVAASAKAGERIKVRGK